VVGWINKILDNQEIRALDEPGHYRIVRSHVKHITLQILALSEDAWKKDRSCGPDGYANQIPHDSLLSSLFLHGTKFPDIE
jgi:hypothetical protein